MLSARAGCEYPPRLSLTVESRCLEKALGVSRLGDIEGEITHGSPEKDH
jgi:hypothetical protein